MRWYWNLSNGIKSEDCICWLPVEIRSNQLKSTECVTYLDAFKEKESVFSISLQLSGYYWQMRWYWNLSNGIKSEDCICWLPVEIRSNQLKSTECVTYLDAIKEKESVFSISLQLLGYYWQMRWYWNLSNGIKSKDCICWLAVEIRSNQLQSTECVTYLDAIKEKESVFSISLQLSGYYWQMRWYWNLSNGIKSEDCICWLAVEIRSKQRKSTKFVTFLMQLKKQEVHFQYHLNFQDDTDIWVAIELCLTGSNRKTVYAGWQLKFDQIDINHRNLSLTWMQLRKRKCIFNITSIVRILLTNEVILKLV